MSKIDDYKDLINDIAKEQAHRRETTPRPSEEEMRKSAEKLISMGIPLESVAEGLGITVEQLNQLRAS